MSFPATYPDLRGKVALVTGAGTGIGKAAALALGQAGAVVAVAEINETSGLKTASEITATGGRAIFIQTDVSNSASIKVLVEQVVAEYGKLDIAVNNAALPPDYGSIANLNEDIWERLIGVNLSGIAFCLKWELRQMQAQGNGGAIINMASATSIKAEKNLPAYSAAKHGVVSLTRVAALENGEHKIRVNALAPGAVSTELTLNTLAKMGTSEEEYAPRVGLFGRFARPAEIAQAVLWLASDVSAYMTGTVVPVDSGLTIV
jgi:NAD(P)-dependent dehydrogenase (short-subunit alcohol dehydrogenase family)